MKKKEKDKGGRVERERHERTGREKEKGAKGEEAGVACRLEIIGARVSGQSVIFIVDAVVKHNSLQYFFAYRNQRYRSSQFHLIGTWGVMNYSDHHYKRTH